MIYSLRGFLGDPLFLPHLAPFGFSAKLKIEQVPACKMEPLCGIILDHETTHSSVAHLAELVILHNAVIVVVVVELNGAYRAIKFW